MTSLSSPFLYVDTAQPLTVSAEYVGYQIKNDTGVAITDLWVKLTTAGTIVTLATNEDGLYHVGPLAVNATANVYFYVKMDTTQVPGVGATAPQSQTVAVYDGNPNAGGVLVCGNNSFNYTVEDLIDANANKPDVVTISGDTNGCFTVQVTGITGTVGDHNNANITYTPAANPNFPADAYELTGTNITYSGGPVGGINDKLFVDGLSMGNKTYTITYTFCKRQNVALPAFAPLTYISSGSNNDKYGPVDPAVTISLNALKSVSPTGTVAAGTKLTYTITINNTGSIAATGMQLIDAIPANTTYVANSTTLNGGAVADVAGAMPYTSLTEIHSPGAPNGTIAAGQSAIVSFMVTVNNPTAATSVSNFATFSGTKVPPTNTNTVTNPICQPPATPTISGTLTFCQGGSSTLTASGTGTFMWFKDGVLIPGEITNMLTVATSGSYTVKVTDANNCSSATSSPAVVTVNPLPPTPTIGGTLSFCQGGSTKLTASGSGMFMWFKDNSMIAGQTTNMLTVTEAGSYTVKVTDGNNCASAISNPAIVTVNPLPPTPTISGNLNFCQGSNTTLTATGTGTFMWFKDGNVIVGETSSTLNVTMAGSYTVKVTDANNCASATSNAAVVSVNFLPTTPVISGNLSFCQGSSSVLTATGTGTFMWFKDGSMIAGQSTNMLTVTEAGSYTVKVTDANTCASPPSNPVIVIVNPLPPTPAISGNLNFCQGDSTTLTATGSGTFMWFKDGNMIVGQTTNMLTVTTAGSYTVKVTDANNCASATSNAAVVTVNPLPPTPTISGNLSFCQGGSTTLTATGTGTFMWFKDGNLIAGQTTNMLTVADAGSYTVKVTDGNNCASPTSTPAVVTVNPLPPTPAITGIFNFCQGGNTKLTASGSGPFMWYKNGIMIPGETTNMLTVTEAGSYTVKVTDANNCASAISSPAVITINPLPATPMISGNLSFCPGGNTTLTATGTGTFMWFKDNVLIPSQTTSSLLVTAAGSYTAKVTDANNCASATSNAAVVTVSPAPATPVISGALNFCEGAGTTLTATGTGTFMWFKDNVLIPGQTTNSLTVTMAGSYTVKVADGGICSSALSDPAVVTVQQCIDLAITKTDGSLTYTPGNPISYTIEVTNAGPSNATGASISDAVPAAITGTTVNCVASGTASCGTNASAGNNISFTGVSIAAGAANFLTLTVSGTVSAGTTGNLVNSAIVVAGSGQTDTVPGNNSATDTDTLINQPPTLRLKIHDPLVCNGPGGLASATAILTNPDNTDQAASITVTLPAGLTALAGTCNASINPGGCVIAGDGGSVTWNGTIPAGQTVTLAYQTQIDVNTPQGTQLCVNATGTVGRQTVNVQECMTVNCPMCLLPWPNLTMNVGTSAQKAGSLLVFPYYVSKASENRNTRLNISNVGLTSAIVHLFLIDGTSCNQSDLFLCLSPNASYSFTASDYDPENTGFIYAVAVNNEGRPIANNALIGNAFVNDGDYVGNYAAEAFARHDTALTSIAGGFAVLGLNGTQYDAAPIQLAAEIQSPVDSVGQKIVVAPLSGDITGGLANLGNAFPALANAAAQSCVGLASNEQERVVSFSVLLSGGCLKSATITTTFPRVPNGMGGLIPTGKTGALNFRVGAGVGLLLTPGGGSNQWRGIRALHKTAKGNMAIAIPIFTPVC
ncbi:MAG TPA: hypothetical protein VFZ34_02900 [Blastocatellia bacterium]|nr:hypothetical protein [Blastocatellia bacterium]